MQHTIEHDVEHLNSFLRGELSAVETYQQCIERMGDEPMTQEELRNLQVSHLRRVQSLEERIRQLGGKPVDNSGVWGGFARLVEGSSKVLGKGAALAALEEGEDHGRNDYKRDLDDLSPELRVFVQSQLIPEQERTHGALSALKKRHN